MLQWGPFALQSLFHFFFPSPAICIYLVDINVPCPSILIGETINGPVQHTTQCPFIDIVLIIFHQEKVTSDHHMLVYKITGPATEIRIAETESQQ